MTLSAIGALGMIVSSFLPETLGSGLPQNIEDAEEFLTKEKYFSYRGRKLGPGCRWYISGQTQDEDQTPNGNIKQRQTDGPRQHEGKEAELYNLNSSKTAILNSGNGMNEV